MTTAQDAYWDMTKSDMTPSDKTDLKIFANDLRTAADRVLDMAEQISSDVDGLAAGHRRLVHVAMASQRVLEARALEGLPNDVEPYAGLVRALENV